jgi:hypothetical protein
VPVLIIVVVVVVLVEVWSFPYLRFVGEKEEKEEVPVLKKRMVGGWICSSKRRGRCQC